MIYLFTNHQGTPELGRTGNGTWKYRDHYTPYGEHYRKEHATSRNNPGFTGHVEDYQTDLTYMQARYYDPVLGRFLSNDPLGFADSRFDPAYFNRYAYTANDPVNLTDPTGKCPWCAVGTIVSGGLQLASEVRNGNINLRDGIQKSDLQAGGRVAVAAGAVGGGAATAIAKAVVGNTVKAAAVRVGANAAAGAVNGGATSAATSAVSGQEITAGDVAKSAAVGAVLSGGGAAVGEGIEAVGRAAAGTQSLSHGGDSIEVFGATAGNTASTAIGNADKLQQLQRDEELE